MNCFFKENINEKFDFCAIVPVPLEGCTVGYDSSSSGYL